jgi:hypothetical protein
MGFIEENMMPSADGSSQSSKFNISKREWVFCAGESFEAWVDLSFSVWFLEDFQFVIVVNTSYVTQRLFVTTNGTKKWGYQVCGSYCLYIFKGRQQ